MMKTQVCGLWCVALLHGSSFGQIVLDTRDDKTNPVENSFPGFTREELNTAWSIYVPYHDIHGPTRSSQLYALNVAFKEDTSEEKSCITSLKYYPKQNAKRQIILDAEVQDLIKKSAITHSRSFHIGIRYRYASKGYMSSAIALAIATKLQDKEIHPKLAIYTKLTNQNSDYRQKSICFDWNITETQNHRVLVPTASESDFKEFLVDDKADIFLNTELIGVDTIEEALEFVALDNESKTHQASKLFEEIRETIQSKPLLEMTKNKFVRAKLKEVYQLNPHHISAKMLLYYGSDACPKFYSTKYVTQAVLQTLEPVEDYLNNNSARSSSPIRKANDLDKFIEELDALSANTQITDKEYLTLAEEIVSSTKKTFVKQVSAVTTTYTYSNGSTLMSTDSRSDLRSIRTSRRQKYIDESKQLLENLKTKIKELD